MNIKRLNDRAIVPTRATEFSAGYDLYYAEDMVEEIVLMPDVSATFGTGWAMEIPKGYVGLLFARSGLACKRGVRPANCVGVIDSDYRGEVKVVLRNDSNCNQSIKLGDRIAQLVIVPYADCQMNEVEELSETVRSEGGFGSTGR